MNIVIHIGFHKTGTSALQAYCRENSNTLKQAGILYPLAGQVELSIKSTSTAEGGQRLFDVALISPESRDGRSMLQAIEAEAKENDCNNIFISSETFSAPRIKISDHIYERMSKIFNNIKILIYVRRQDYWADSFYREYLCWPRKRERRDYENFCQEFLPEWLDYERRIDVWAERFGAENIIIRSYDDRVHANIVQDTFETLGWKVPNFSMSNSNNPSLPSHLVNFVRELNQRVKLPEDKAALTSEIFDRLSESKLEADAVPLRSAWLESQKEAFAQANDRLAQAYKMPPAPIFCFRENVNSKDQRREPTLAEADLKGYLARFEHEKKKLKKILPNSGTWGVSCLCNENIAQTGTFVDYHLAIGASKVILFLDNPDDPIRGFFSEESRVTFVPCTEQFWLDAIGRSPENNAEKLAVAHRIGLEQLREKHELDWAINLDADELIWVEEGYTFNRLLAKASKRANQIVLPPLEAIFVDEADAKTFGARYFKVHRTPDVMPGGTTQAAVFLKRSKTLARKISRRIPPLTSFLNAVIERILPKQEGQRGISIYSKGRIEIRYWSAKDQYLYGKAMPVATPVLRDGFLAHRQGRVATARGVLLDIVKSHRHNSTRDKIRQIDTNGVACILHYDAVDYDAWHLKWHRRVFGGANVLKIGEERKKQQDMFLTAAQAGETRKLFRDLFFLPQQWLTDFVHNDLVVQITPPGIEEISRKWRAIEADYREADTARDGTDKAR